jgi:RNA-directed DNA polymerase
MKTVPIEFKQVHDSYVKVKKGGKATGVDSETISDFEKNIEANLYLIHNRLSSGSYHPPAVRTVEIPKKDGKTRKLGIPTLRDKIAQQVVRDHMEKQIEPLFHSSSYGYRPLHSAKDALLKVKENCRRYDWVIDMDIKGFFDEIDHDLMLKALEHVVKEKWVITYVSRWLKAPSEDSQGHQHERTKGTPQGGVISPLLANLFLHYAFDMWMSKHFPIIRFVRYADDIIVHCYSQQEADKVLTSIKEVRQKLSTAKTNGERRITKKFNLDFLVSAINRAKQKVVENIHISHLPRPLVMQIRLKSRR